jgi:hypothetical protein
MQPETHHPVTHEDAAILFREAKSARKAGGNVRIGIVESPYRPAKVADAETILISCERMNRIVEVSTTDLLAVVEGGVTYADFSAAVREAGLYFPHVAGEDVTIAEMIMDGTIFPTEGAFGGLRESVLSVELLTPDAEKVRFGSRAIKDVGGYEIISFMMGQGGRCGMITSVTLRLLSQPCCRAYIAGRGDGRALKTLAHNLRKEFRPASIEMLEGRAADLVIGAWMDTVSSEGSKLSHLFEAEGDTLLVGELQGLEPAVDDQLHRLVDSSESEHAAFILANEELLDIARRHLVQASVRSSGCVSRICFDGPYSGDFPDGSLVRRSLYPERLDILVPIEPDSAGPIDGIHSNLEIERLVTSVIGTGQREQIGIIEYEDGVLERTRIRSRDLLRLVETPAGLGGGRADQIEQARALEELNSKILSAFDPDGIMLA